MKAEPFYDERLSPQQNKAVEMLRNGFTRAEICDEMDIHPKHLSVLFYAVRKHGIDIPKAKAGNPRPGKIPIQKLLALYAQLEQRGFKGAGLWQTMSDRTGLSINCMRVRLWRYHKGIGPRYAKEEGQAA